MLFADLEGSARLMQALGAAYRPMLDAYRQVVRRALPCHGAVEVSVVGDVCFFAFREAASAVRGCLAAQGLLAGTCWPEGLARPRVRIGVHTAFADPVDGEYVGIEVVRAARVAAAALGGQILCSATTAACLPVHMRRTLLVDLGPHRLADFAESLRLFQIGGTPARNGTGQMMLTRAESTVAGLVAQGLSNPQIAQQLCISRYTVETHIKHIFVKLAVRSRAGLAAKVAASG
jgi:class 3 adenylate cyclase